MNFLLVDGGHLSILVQSWSLALVLAITALMNGCALAEKNKYVEANQRDAGSIEFVNKSPDSLVSVAVFDDSNECRGTKFAVALEKLSEKLFKASHRENLTVWVTYTQLNKEKFKGCGAIFSLPFSKGDLRITGTAAAAIQQCDFQFESRLDGVTWIPTPNPMKRTRRQSVLFEDAGCEKVDS